MAGVYSDCDICDQIWKWLNEPSLAHVIDLGSPGQAYETKCTRHGPLFRAFIDCCKEESPSGLAYLNLKFGSSDKDAAIMALTPPYPFPRIFKTWRILAEYNDLVVNHPSLRRVMDPDWVDLDIVKKWKVECFSSHGSKCNNPLKIFSAEPAWLIDVIEECLVPGKGHDHYVALSYAAGGKLKVVTSLEIIARFRQPHSLSELEAAPYLTPVFCHAMKLTVVIGERYLWIDSLCINHGDRESLNEQLNLMGAIYASAKITIVGTDSDAKVGLCGLEGISPSRGLKQRVLPFGEEVLIVHDTDNDGWTEEYDDTAYNNRGWTYQEYQMSQRKIVFNRKQVHWHCSCSVWHEELKMDFQRKRSNHRHLDTLLAGFPDLSSLGFLIHRYNERILRYDEDALPGILGLLAVMSRSFPGGFLFGIPEIFFDTALSWTPTEPTLRRRKISNRSIDSYLATSSLPSWSWIGWQGSISGLSDRGNEGARLEKFARLPGLAGQRTETFPITEWYTSSSPSDPPSQRRRIRAFWPDYREKFKAGVIPLPSGWTRHVMPKLNSNEGPWWYASKFVYKHLRTANSDFSGGPTSDFWSYPVPVTDIDSAVKPYMPIQTSYLFCETKFAKLWAHLKDESYTNFIYKKITLRDLSCTDVGRLDLHTSNDQQLFPQNLAGDALGRSVNLVAINLTRTYSRYYNWETKKYNDSIDIKEEYKVLWVDEKEGVHYRLASGVVNKEAWENLELKDISLILG